MRMNVPAPFPGTPEEAARNRNTHQWDYSGEGECFQCLSKPWHTAASYPCGEEPPRVVIDGDPGVYIAQKIAPYIH